MLCQIQYWFFYAVGFELKEVNIELEVLLMGQLPDTKALSEVVVTGTGALPKKKNLTAVESIFFEKLPAAPTASIDQALVENSMRRLVLWMVIPAHR